MSLREVWVRQFERVQRREALVVPEQLVFQKLDGVQREDDRFMFQQAVDIQTWQRKDTAAGLLAGLHTKDTVILKYGSEVYVYISKRNLPSTGCHLYAWLH